MIYGHTAFQSVCFKTALQMIGRQDLLAVICWHRTSAGKIIMDPPQFVLLQNLDPLKNLDHPWN